MKEIKKNSYHRIFWPIYFLNGFQSIGWGGITFLIVPISRIMWPNEPSHALEMGILITALSWAASISGLLFGHLIDKYSRKAIITIISLFRGLAFFMLGLAMEGGGFATWIYFVIFISVFGSFAGLSWPTVISLSNDVVPKDVRSRFFGIYEIIRSFTMILGFFFGALLMQIGLWRQYFWSTGTGILIFGFIFFVNTKEPKRGAQQEELIDLLLKDDIEYNFQINRETLKKTMLSKTNIVALIEGIFTWILMGSINFLILNLIQNPPHNISEFSTSIFMIAFGLTGGLVGQLGLARLSDRLAKKHSIIRIPIIVIAILGGLITFALFFFLPWPNLTIDQGKDILYLLALPNIWLMGSMFFFSRSIFSLYIVNQSPVLQEINLPEAQGKIVSWNQFLENLGRGIGPTLSGLLLVLTDMNYQVTILFLILCILPGVILWVLAINWYPKDVRQVRNILSERADLLKSQNSSTQ